MSAHVASRLSAFLDRELTEAEALEVRQHVADCEACAAQLRELESVTRAFAEMPADPPAGYFDSFSARVRSRIEKAPAARTGETSGSPGFHLPAWSWAIAAALLLGVLLPRLPWEGRRPGTRAEREGVAGAPPATAPPTAPAAPAAAPTPAERFAAAPAPLASPTRTETTDLTARRRAEEPAVDSAGGRTPAAAPAEAPPAMKKDAPEQDIARPKSNEAARPRLEESRPRPEGFADAKAPAEPAVPADTLGKSEDARPAMAAELEAGTVAAGRVQELKRQPSAPGKEARSGAAAEPDVQAQFEALSARRPASLPELRRLREAWRSFLARDPEGPRADEARVAMVSVSVQIAGQSRDARDQAQARRDGEDYLARSDAAQKARVEALLLRLEGTR